MIYYNVLSKTLKVPLDNDNDEIMVFSDRKLIVQKEVSITNEMSFSFPYNMDMQSVDIRFLHIVYLKNEEVISVITDEIVDNYNSLKLLLCDMQLNSKIDYMNVRNHLKKYGGDLSDIWSYLKNNSIKEFFWVFGNFQSTFYNNLLLTSKLFKDKYVLVITPPIQYIEGVEKRNGFNTYFLQCIDVVVYQHIEPNNKFSIKLSTDTIIRKMLEKTKKICIPDAYFNAYFPFVCSNPYELKVPRQRRIFPDADCNIDVLIEKGKSISEIIDLLSAPDFYSPEYCMARVEDSLFELREREKLCDVTISDFIKGNYKKQRLFYTYNHPINIVLHEILKRIFSQIGLKDDIIEDEVEENNTYETPIYPSVQLGLGLEFTEEKINYCKLSGKGSVTFAEYIRDYCERRIFLMNKYQY